MCIRDRDEMDRRATDVALKLTADAQATETATCYVQPIYRACLLYTSPSPRDRTRSRMPSSA